MKGLGLLVALALFLFVVFKMLAGPAGGHPLAGAARPAICAALAPLAARGHALREVPAADPRLTPRCAVRAPGAAAEIEVALVTRRHLADDGASPAQTTAAYVETWVAESTASGERVEPLPGPWVSGYRITRPGQERAQVLADGDGVVLWMTTESSAADLAAVAATVAETLANASP